METTDTIRDLLRKHLAGTLSRTEKKALLQSIETMDAQFTWKAVIAELSTEATSTELVAHEWEPVLQTILSNKASAPMVHRVHFLKRAWVRYAALLLLIAGTATFLYLNNQSPKEIVQSHTPIEKPTDILPGGNRAILTLSDGSTIVLDSAANGALAQQGGTKIVKLDAGSLAYQAGVATGEVMFNTISTPKGGQYQITLPDGTKVWLNAASSIQFPSTFSNHERSVIVTGEVYLEVVKNKQAPFTVTGGNTSVVVLGTSFNMNAYEEEEAVKTTLIEGAVRVAPAGANSGAVVLRAGQQALSAYNGVVTGVESPDLSGVLAWKNGFFSFNNAGIKTVMRQLERWYDIKVEYNGAVPSVRLNGELDRQVPLSDVLNYLSRLNIKFEKNGRTITVMP